MYGAQHPFPSPSALANYHPVIVEGMGGYDLRAPSAVAEAVLGRLARHWQQWPIDKPPMVVIQGDPPAPRGISAITPFVAEGLRASRALVCLDEHTADYHARDADRDNVGLEFRYSQLTGVVDHHHVDGMQRLAQAVDWQIATKNARRQSQGKPPLKSYFRDFALLQEVTKAACRALCGGVTIAHTAEDIHEFSVTSFYTVGLELGLVDPAEIVAFR
ncbi:shikimate kinase [Spiribacter salinus]|nr:shikimate kinase [Spiribacter salinus]